MIEILSLKSCWKGSKEKFEWNFFWSKKILWKSLKVGKALKECLQKVRLNVIKFIINFLSLNFTLLHKIMTKNSSLSICESQTRQQCTTKIPLLSFLRVKFTIHTFHLILVYVYTFFTYTREIILSLFIIQLDNCSVSAVN